MTIGEHKESFGGLPAHEFEEGKALSPRYAWRVYTSFEGKPWAEVFEAFVASAGVDQIEALLVGSWATDVDDGEYAPEVVEALVAAAPRLPKLRALFIGDITFEENEISWIHNTNLSPLLEAFPALEVLGARGGNGLRLESAFHASLRELVFETGGLSAATVADVLAADLPALRKLELWLGDEGYGRDTGPAELAPLLRGECFPDLLELGLRNADNADDIAEALSDAKVVAQLKVLDLSLGTLSDAGAEHLLRSTAIRGLVKLDLHHHYLSEEMQKRLAVLGPQVDLSDEQDPDEDYRAPAVSE